ncbi:MAG TPA: flagellar hook-basal body protein [Desulfobacteraceae bacterium]|nr:flagellar hook-basal body protein [Desulfobacteraceae bacterium]
MILEMTRPTQGGLRQERKLEAVSNNLANAQTVGFKRDFVSFDKEFKAQLNRDYTLGEMEYTDNPLDYALETEGFFKIETPEGLRYTRNGSFSVSAEGILVDKNGFPVMGQGGNIIIDTNEVNETVEIGLNGQITIDNVLVDTLDVVTFADKTKLEKDGRNLLSYTGNAEDELAPELVRGRAGALEQSNVHVVDEMVRMIDYQKMFEMYTKSMMTFDEVDSKAINEVGQTT